MNAYFTRPLDLNKLRRETFSEAEVRQAYEEPEVRDEFTELVPGVLKP